MAELKVNGHTIEAASQQEGGPQFSEDAQHSDHLLIQFKTSLNPATLSELQSHHVQILHYAGKNTYVCSYAPEDLTVIRALPFVEYANVYHNDMVIGPDLAKQLSSADPTKEEAYAVRVHDEGKIDATMDEISSLIGIAHAKVKSEGYGQLAIPLTSDQVFKIAEIDNVQAILSKHPEVIYNHKASKIMEADWDSNQSFAEMVWKKKKLIGKDKPPLRRRGFADNVKGFSKDDFRAANEVLGVCDTGLDLGDWTEWGNADHDNHPANIEGRTPPTEVNKLVWPPEGETMSKVHEAFGDRVVAWVAAGGRTAGGSDSAHDAIGHGTHVAGSMCGNFSSLGGSAFGQITAPASQASLFVVACDNISVPQPRVDTDGFPALIQQWMIQAYNGRRARVWNFSNGPPFNPKMIGVYDDKASQIDRLVHTCQDTVIVKAAGNAGRVEMNSLGDRKQQTFGMSNARNVIVVGATESNIGSLGDAVYSELDLDGEQIKLEHAAYDPDHGTPPNPYRVCSFSSRGPTATGLIKPDVVAPGAVIYSASTRAWVKPRGFFGDSPDPKGCFQSGTSMAAPLVASCCGIIRSVYLTVHGYFPSAAMVKALLINGAVDMSDTADYTPGAWHGGVAPNIVQGHGRVNLRRSLRNMTDTVKGGLYDSQRFPSAQPSTAGDLLVPKSIRKHPLAPSEIGAAKSTKSRTFFAKAKNKGRLSVTLAYSDPWSVPLSDEDLTNDVTLKVIEWDPKKKPGQKALQVKEADRSQGTVRKIVWKGTKESPIFYKIVVGCKDFAVVNTVQEQHYAVCWMAEKPQ